MNVTLITMAYPHPRAGFWPSLERQVADLAAALRDAGVTVNVITSFQNGGPAREEHESIRIFRVPNSSQRFGRLGYVMNMHVWTLGANALKLRDVVGATDVIHSHIPLPVSPALKRPGLAVVAFFPHRDRPSRPIEYLIHPANYWMEKAYFRHVHTVIVASAESRRVLIDEYEVPESRIEVVPIGVSRNFLSSVARASSLDPVGREPGSGPALLLYIGQLIPRKGLHTLIDALPTVRDAGLSVRAVLVGKGHEEKSLRESVARRGLDDVVEFRERVAEEDLPALYRSADLFVFPSLQEGFGMVLIEAMACELPIVASSAPPIPEVAGDAGLYFRPGDSREMAEKIIQALRDRHLRSRLAAEGLRRVAERFTWSRIAERTLEIYRRAGAR